MAAQAIWFFVVLVAAAASTIGALLRAKRRSTAAAIAARAGLQFSADDPFNCTRVAFPLFRRGDGHGAENVMWKPDDGGRPIRAFDYWYYTVHRDQYGRETRDYRRFTCATALIGGNWPPLTVTREGLLDKVVDGIASVDIDFESEEFNRTFAIRCDDRRFASTLIDPRMMELLLSTRGELNFEVRGRWLLVWAAHIPAALMPGLVRLCEKFVETIPAVVWDLYPSPFIDEDGEPLPAEDEFYAIRDLMDAERAHERALEHDPWETVVKSPFDALHDPSRPEYDLDGNVIAPKPENPWGDQAPHA